MDETNTATGTDEAVTEVIPTAPVQSTKSSRRKPAHAAAVSTEPVAPVAEPWPPKAPAGEDVPMPPLDGAVEQVVDTPADEAPAADEAPVNETPVEIEDAPEIELAEVVDITPPAEEALVEDVPADDAPAHEDLADEPIVPASAASVASSSSFVSSFSQAADAGVADLTAGVKAAGAPAAKRAASAAGAGVIALLVLRKGLRRRAKRHAG